MIREFLPPFSETPSIYIPLEKSLMTENVGFIIIIIIYFQFLCILCSLGLLYVATFVESCQRGNLNIIVYNIYI